VRFFSSRASPRRAYQVYQGEKEEFPRECTRSGREWIIPILRVALNLQRGGIHQKQSASVIDFLGAIAPLWKAAESIAH